MKKCKDCGRTENQFDKWDSGSNGMLRCRECGNKYRRKYKLRVQKQKCQRCNKLKSKNQFVRLTKDHSRLCLVCYRKGKAQLENVKYSEVGTKGNMVKDGYYLCSICNNIKPLKAFRKHKSNASGVTSSCKSCLKIRDREKKMFYTYGITIEEYNILYDKQNGNCAICHNNLKEGTNDCSIDHNHDNGNIRGLLCNTCNRALGMFQDSPQLLYSAIRYLKASPFKTG